MALKLLKQTQTWLAYTMGKRAYSDLQEAEFITRLRDGWSHAVIISHYKKQGIRLNSSYLTKLKKRKENLDQQPKVSENRGRRPALSFIQLNRLDKITQSTDPPV